MRSWKVIFADRFYTELNDFLFSTSPNENGCFLMATPYKSGRNKSVLIVSDMIKPDYDDWQYSDDSSIAPTSKFINKAVTLADDTGLSPIFVHTHPGFYHPPSFSSIDRSTNLRLFRNLNEILFPRPLGSIVVSGSGMAGVVFSKGKQEDISQVAIVGMRLKDMPISNKHNDAGVLDSRFDRQLRMFGEKNQRMIQQMTVSIVGLGGTGSSVAVQLARVGVGKLILIDNDTIDDSNLTRVYGSTTKDVGKAKVVVVRKHLMSFSKSTKIETLERDVTKDNVIGKLIESDLIFGCTDTFSSRAILNDVSIQYYIPLIDIGCKIHKQTDGETDQVIAKIQVVTPDSACLWCTGTLDGVTIMQETLSQDERNKLKQEGYLESTDKQPSIISLTSLAASLGISKFLQMLTGPTTDSRTQIELVNSMFLNDSPKIKKDCICQERRGKAGLRRII